MDDLENSLNQIKAFLETHNEWLLIDSAGKSFALQKNEFELSILRGKIIFGFLDEKGFKIWRVRNFVVENDKITLELTGNFAKESKKVRLVGRVSTSRLSEAVELARLERVNRIAASLPASKLAVKIIRVTLNEKNGRFGQIIFANLDGRQIAALADVSEVIAPENLLTTAILWLAKLENRQKNPIEEVWILAEKKRAKNLQKLHALLAENWKRKINVWEISTENKKAQSADELILKRLKNLEISVLRREKTKEIAPRREFEISRAAREITEFAPEKIDVIFTGHGETLRFFGLPFVRVRRVFGEEKIWFGIERERRILSENSREDFFDLMENLQNYRRFDSVNERHQLFRRAPEAWLEAILRRNVKLLDANLVLAPIHNQFRASGDKIDLLALRADGRLIVVELKVAPDREMIFQAADYWRKIESRRRSGVLRTAKIFGNLEISDAPTIVYLAAPTLSYHYDFDFLAKTIAPEIEIFRFDLNENWRENLKVMNRRKI